MAGDPKLRFFGRVELIIAGPATFKGFFSLGQCKMLPARVWPGLLYRGVELE